MHEVKAYYGRRESKSPWLFLSSPRAVAWICKHTYDLLLITAWDICLHCEWQNSYI